MESQTLRSNDESLLGLEGPPSQHLSYANSAANVANR